MGNYFGALDQWIALQDEFTAYYCIVDLHSLTVPYEALSLAARTRETAALLVALGIDPDVSTVFVQSHVPEHAELCWLLSCLASFGDLRRMVQFKEKAEQSEFVSLGLFSYPALMAADILLYQPELVPVGEDQRQHLELARSIAGRFNRRYGEVMTVPEGAVPSIAARVMDLQRPTAKMSKTGDSEDGVVYVLDEPDAVRDKVRRAVTDSSRVVQYAPESQPGVSNLVAVLAATTRRGLDETAAEFADQGYGRLKEAVAEAIIERFRAPRERYGDLVSDPAELERLLERGREHAQETAGRFLCTVRGAMGLLPRALPRLSVGGTARRRGHKMDTSAANR